MSVYIVEEVVEYNIPIAYVMTNKETGYRSQQYPHTDEALAMLKRQCDFHNKVPTQTVYRKVY